MNSSRFTVQGREKFEIDVIVEMERVDSIILSIIPCNQDSNILNDCHNVPFLSPPLL